jgi:hypothetical protein
MAQLAVSLEYVAQNLKEKSPQMLIHDKIRSH